MKYPSLVSCLFLTLAGACKALPLVVCDEPPLALLTQDCAWEPAAPVAVLVLGGGLHGEGSWNDVEVAERVADLRQSLSRSTRPRVEVLGVLGGEEFEREEIEPAVRRAVELAERKGWTLLVYAGAVGLEYGNDLALLTQESELDKHDRPSDAVWLSDLEGWMQSSSLEEGRVRHVLLLDLVAPKGAEAQGSDANSTVAQRKVDGLEVRICRRTRGAPSDVAVLAQDALNATGPEPATAALDGATIPFQVAARDAETDRLVVLSQLVLGTYSSPEVEPGSDYRLPPGRHFLRAQAPGYLPRSCEVEVTPSCAGSVLCIPMLQDHVWIRGQTAPGSDLALVGANAWVSSSGYARPCAVADSFGRFLLVGSVQASGFKLAQTAQERHEFFFDENIVSSALRTRRPGWSYDHVRVIDVGGLGAAPDNGSRADFTEAYRAQDRGALQEAIGRLTALASRSTLPGERSGSLALAKHLSWVCAQLGQLDPAHSGGEGGFFLVRPGDDLEKAIGTADEIQLASGRFEAPRRFERTVALSGRDGSGAGEATVLQTDGSEPVELLGPGVTLRGIIFRGSQPLLVKGSGVRFEACVFEIEGPGALLAEGPLTSVELVRCDFRGGGICLDVAQGAQAVARSCSFTEARITGVRVRGQSRLDLERCRIESNYEDGLTAEGPSKITARDTCILRNWGCALQVRDGGDVELLLCSLAGNTRIGHVDMGSIRLSWCTEEGNADGWRKGRPGSEVFHEPPLAAR